MHGLLVRGHAAQSLQHAHVHDRRVRHTMSALARTAPTRHRDAFDYQSPRMAVARVEESVSPRVARVHVSMQWWFT